MGQTGGRKNMRLNVQFISDRSQSTPYIFSLRGPSSENGTASRLLSKPVNVRANHIIALGISTSFCFQRSLNACRTVSESTRCLKSAEHSIGKTANRVVRGPGA